MSDLTRVFGGLLSGAPARRCETLSDFRAAHLARTQDLDLPIDRAIDAGARADRLAWAFAGGYAEAACAMFGAPRERLACLAATEEGGAHPRAIATTLDGLRLSGSKRWVTGGAQAELMYVVARAGERDGHPLLRVVRVDAKALGVELGASGPAPFLPEIEHASVTFRDVAVGAADVLDGDGYDHYLKPFRTIEDVHVIAAVLAWVGAVAARSDWPEAFVASTCAALAGARTLAECDPRSPEVHVALGGFLAEVESLIARAEPWWDRVEVGVREGWQRDRAVLGVASKARAARLEKAWSVLRARRPK
jgi:hypothetical protein